MPRLAQKLNGPTGKEAAKDQFSALFPDPEYQLPQITDKEAAKDRASELLRSYGRVQQMLAEAKKKGKGDLSLLQRITEDWELIVRDIERLLCHPSGLEHPRSRIIERLTYEPNLKDPVFRYSLLVQEEAKAAEKRRSEAIGAYMDQEEDYGLILGDLLPESLIHDAEEAKRRKALKGTGLIDWEEFLRQRENDTSCDELGLKTGMLSFDDATGGLRGFNLLAGPTGAGKTTLALFWTVDVILNNPGTAVLFLTSEMTKKQLLDKLLSLRSGIKYRTVVEKPTPEPAKKPLKEAVKWLGTNIMPHLYILDHLPTTAGRNTLTIRGMLNTVEEMRSRPGINQVLVIIDSLQKVEIDDSEDGRKLRKMKRKGLPDMEIEAYSLKMLLQLRAGTFRDNVPDGFPFLVLSQVRKPYKPGERLTIYDVLGKVNNIHSADGVFLLEPQTLNPSSPEVTPLYLNVGKCRDGGIRGDHRLNFLHTISRFEVQAASTTDARPIPAPVAPGEPVQKRLRGKS